MPRVVLRCLSLTLLFTSAKVALEQLLLIETTLLENVAFQFLAASLRDLLDRLEISLSFELELVITSSSGHQDRVGSFVALYVLNYQLVKGLRQVVRIIIRLGQGNGRLVELEVR